MKIRVLIFSISTYVASSYVCGMEAPPEESSITVATQQEIISESIMTAPPSVKSSANVSSIQSSVLLLQNPCDTSETHRALMKEIFPEKSSESFMRRLLPTWYADKEDKKDDISVAKNAIFDHNACLLWRLSILYGKSFDSILSAVPAPEEAIEINKQLLKSVPTTPQEIIEADGGTLLFKGHGDKVTAITFNPTSNLLITGSADQEAVVWKITQDVVAPQSRLIGPQDTITSIAVNNQNIVLAGSADGRICLWNLIKQESLQVTSLTSPLVKINFYPSGTMFLVQTRDTDKLFFGDIAQNFIPVDKFNHSVVLRGVTEQDIPILPTSQNNYILFSSKGGTAKLYSLDANRLDTKSSLRQQIQLLDVSTTKKLIYTAKDTHKCYILDLKTSRQTELEHRSQRVTAVAISPIGVFAATGTSTGVLKIWNLSNFDCLEIALHRGAITSIAVSPNGRYIATASVDRTVRLYDLFALNSFLDLDKVILIWYLQYKKSISNKPILLSENRARIFRKLPQYIKEGLQKEYTILDAPDSATPPDVEDNDKSTLFTLLQSLLKKNGTT